MAKTAYLFCSLLLILLTCGERLNNTMTWTLNETILSCNKSKQQLDIAGGEYDAIFVELEAKPPLTALFCPNPNSTDSLLSLTVSTGDKVDGSECPNRLRSQWLIHEKRGMSIAVERKQRACDVSFSLNVTYHFWRCWEKKELTADNVPFTMEDLCGQISIESTEPIIRTMCHEEDACILFKNSLPSFIQPGIESLISTDVSIRPKDTNTPLMDLCSAVDMSLHIRVESWSEALTLCYSKIQELHSTAGRYFEIKTEDFFNLPIRNVWPGMQSSWAGNVEFEEYLKQQDQDSPFAVALLKFYDIKINVQFGIFSKQYHLQDEDTRIPIQLRQNSLDMRIQLIPFAILSFSTWIYRIELQVAPGRQLEARWNPLQQVDYYFNFWQPPAIYSDSMFALENFQLLGNYSSGYAKSITNTMTLEASMSQLVSCTSLESKERRGGITVIRFEVISMTDACDEQLRNEMNVSVRRTVLENGEAFHVEKERYLYQDTFNCKLTFRTLTDNSVFLARMYLLFASNCELGRLFVQIGSRYVSLCGSNMAGRGLSFEWVDPYMSIHISRRYVFIMSQVITVIAYIPVTASTSVDSTSALGMRGYLFTTCPLVHSDSDNTPPCAWHSQPGNGDKSDPVYCNSLSTDVVNDHPDRITWCNAPILITSSNASWHSTITQLNFTAINLYNESGIDQPIDRYGLFFSLYRRYLLVNLTFSVENSFLEIQFEFDSISNSSDHMLNIDDALGTMFVSHNPSLYGIRLRTMTPWLEGWYIKRQPCFLMRYIIRNYTQHPLVTAANAGPASPSLVLSFPPSSSPLSWTESNELCRKRNSSLPVIADRNELEQILAAMMPSFEQGKRLLVYLGLRRGNFLSWLDVSVPLTFTEWFKPSDFIDNELLILPPIFNLSRNTPQPTTNNGDCVAMIPYRPSGPANWVMVPCSQQVNDSNVTLVHVCMTRMPNDYADIRPFAPSFCQAGWILLANTCYKMVSSVDMSRDSADAICRGNDALVAHFNVQAHNHLFRMLLQRHADGNKWMNDNENNQMTLYHLLSDVTMELVPARDDTATGVVCERDIVQNVVFLQHHFEIPCDDTSIISFHRWCDGTADCPHREDESTCSSVHVSTQPRKANRNDSSGNETWSDADRAAFMGWIEPDGQSTKRRNTTDGFNVAKEWNLTCKGEEVRCPAEENVSTPCIPETHFCVYGVTGCCPQ